jgi:hypothetical protein
VEVSHFLSVAHETYAVALVAQVALVQITSLQDSVQDNAMIPLAATMVTLTSLLDNALALEI